MRHIPRLALIVSHPIQHFCPQYASFALHPVLVFKVYFASALGYKPYEDPDFRQAIAWNNLQLDKFDNEFLNGDKVLSPDKNLDAPNVERALSDFRPDIIIIYGYFQRVQRRAFRWARKNGVTIAYISDAERRQKRVWWKEVIKYLYFRRFFSGIDYALTVGDANEAYYRYMGLKQGQLLRMHFPIDIIAYQKAFENRKELKNNIREQYDIRPGEFVASVVGKLVHWKNQGDIIDAMKLLEELGVSMQLFVVGSGEARQEWEEKARKLSVSKVHFTGFISPDLLPGYYAASDIYIHPATAEPHSLAISEAIYMGCPVIISDRCGSYGPTDDVQEGKNGWVFPCGDINMLAEKIKWMKEHPEELKRFGEYGHDIAESYQKVSHKGIIDKLVEKLESYIIP